MLVQGSGDEGLFGLRSVTWRIHSDPCMLIGGMRALLMQALNPLAIAAVAQHSNYREDPWKRLLGTTHYIMATTFGDTAAAHAAVDKVRTIHAHVKGVDDYTGLSYSADDPELLLWVHACEVDSFLTGYRRYGRPLSPEDRDRYVTEMAVVAELFDIPPLTIPRSVRDLEDYFESREFVASPDAREAMRFILYVPVPLPGGRIPEVPGGRLLLIPGRAVYSTYAAATIAILPKRVRRAYGLPWIPLNPALQATVYGLVRTVRRVTPPPQVIRDALARRDELLRRAAA